jgi:transporter family protein
MDYAWLIFALLSAVFAALVAIFGKIGLQGLDANTATTVRAVIMAVFLIIVILIEGKLGKVSEILSNNKALFYITLSGIAGALSWLFYFLAVKIGEVSKVAPVDKLSVVFAIVLAIIILGEKLTWAKAIGAALITIGVIIIAIL